MIRLIHIMTVPGSLFFLRGQAAFMRARGIEIQAISSPGVELTRFGEEEGVETVAVPMERSVTPLRDLKVLARLVSELRKRKPAMVHAHTPKGGLLGMIAAVIARVPVRIYHVHGMPFVTASGPLRWLLRQTERISCALAHQVLCVSETVREVAVREGVCPAAKISVLLRGSINGVDAEVRFNPDRLTGMREVTRARSGIPLEAKVIGFIGRLVREKGIAELTAAFGVLRQEFPQLHLLLVGPFEPRDPVEPEVEKRLREDSHVHLLGLDWDTPPLYAAVDVLALPTWREGFPVVPLEAAAMGLPVVATRVPGSVDAVLDGVTGTLVPARDPVALAEALRTYLRDPVLGHQHGSAGRARVLLDFQQERMWKALAQIYLQRLEAAGLNGGRRRVAVIGSFARSLTNFRGELMREMVAAGHVVRAMAPEQDEEVVQQLESWGISFTRISLSRTGINPLGDLSALAAFARELRRFRADTTLTYTAKPVIYGTLGAKLAGVGNRCAMITGIGSAFGHDGRVRRAIETILRALYLVALRHAKVVFFQNPDDEALFRKFGLLNANPRVVRINGSGVDLNRFAVTPLPSSPQLIFLMVARLLHDKGVVEYAEAARAIQRLYPKTRFRLLGGLDPNPSAVSQKELEGWRAEGVIEYLGTAADVRPALTAAHVFVLPSYSEGTPRSVLEAMAMARPILTTDAPGCRETVEPGVNGLLVRPRDAAALAEGMRKMIELSGQPGALEAMGKQSRVLAERKFDVRAVNRVIMDAMGLSRSSQSERA